MLLDIELQIWTQGPIVIMFEEGTILYCLLYSHIWSSIWTLDFVKTNDSLYPFDEAGGNYLV